MMMKRIFVLICLFLAGVVIPTRAAHQAAIVPDGVPDGLTTAEWNNIQRQVMENVSVSQPTLLRASNPGVDDQFGFSVAVSGNTTVVGAQFEDGAGDGLSDSGAAYVFERNEGGTGNWGETAVLRASNAGSGDRFGVSVGVSGDTIVVGANYEDGEGDGFAQSGAAYVFERNAGGAGNWGETIMLRASNTEAIDLFGISVAVSGDTVVVGASYEDGAGNGLSESGAAYVFERNEDGVGNWGETAVLRASNAGWSDFFGNTVAVSGDTAVVGAFNEDGEGDGAGNSGAAYVFERNEGGAGNWGETALLRASNAGAEDYFGVSVAVSGDTVIVGANGEDAPGGLIGNGAAYVFERNEGGADNWGETALLRASNADGGDYFGISVAVSGDMVVVGAMYEDGEDIDVMSTIGAAYIFKRDEGGAGNWGEVDLLHASNAGDEDFLGHSVAVSGNTAIAGAHAENGAGDGLADSGAAYVFKLNEGAEKIYLPIVVTGN